MDTPLSGSPPGDLDVTLNAIALIRIFSPALTIPAVSALEMLAPGGQLRALQAGANVVTVNFTPPREARAYSIYGRTKPMVGLARALDLIEEAGLRRGRATEADPLPASVTGIAMSSAGRSEILGSGPLRTSAVSAL
jgi:biotin synthase